ncbi:MAG: BrnA antitoxin family protein [Alphaproteobacteria bacterium]|uniref:BrnA antitoxin family protein n=1 Tax=Nisaea sp. TaxID=2024842 RepID=UPI00326648C3
MSKPGTPRKPKAKTESAGKASDTFDWSAFDDLDDADIAEAVRQDPDAAPIADEGFWSRAKVVMPTPKQAISIRLDTDVLDFFKDEGPGYQSRINAVLRSYMDAKK